MARHYFSDVARPTTLTVGMTAVQATMTVAATTGFPTSFPYYLVIDQGVPAALEVVRVTGAVGLTLTIVRAVTEPTTAAVTHLSGASVIHVAAAGFFNEASQIVADGFPVGAGAWSNWTPTVTQSTSVGLTITRARYTRVGRLVRLSAEITMTGTGVAGNIIVISGLPYNAEYAGAQAVGTGIVYDLSTFITYPGLLRFQGTDNTMSLLSTQGSGVLGNTTFTAALTAGDILRFEGAYESA